MSRPDHRIILGIDPGTTVMGYGLLEVVGKTPKMLALGVLEAAKIPDPYMKLLRIYERVEGLIEEFRPDELAIEAPFYGQNPQTMLKLGRAQGVAMAAALKRQLVVAEYAPLRIKQSITGSGSASKEQVAAMLCHILHLDPAELPPQLDATDGLAAALCHFYQTSNPLAKNAQVIRDWKDFARQNPHKIHKSK